MLAQGYSKQDDSEKLKTWSIMHVDIVCEMLIIILLKWGLVGINLWHEVNLKACFETINWHDFGLSLSLHTSFRFWKDGTSFFKVCLDKASALLFPNRNLSLSWSPVVAKCKGLIITLIIIFSNKPDLKSINTNIST